MLEVAVLVVDATEEFELLLFVATTVLSVVSELAGFVASVGELIDALVASLTDELSTAALVADVSFCALLTVAALLAADEVLSDEVAVSSVLLLTSTFELVFSLSLLEVVKLALESCDAA
ncbi:hypothetical protein IV84_GL000155 [Pediococcus damnosus]|nr:hypothetical protein IV84_GL000155 [Pediococcus damnosus]